MSAARRFLRRYVHLLGVFFAPPHGHDEHQTENQKECSYEDDLTAGSTGKGQRWRWAAKFSGGLVEGHESWSLFAFARYRSGFGVGIDLLAPCRGTCGSSDVLKRPDRGGKCDGDGEVDRCAFADIERVGSCQQVDVVAVRGTETAVWVTVVQANALPMFVAVLFESSECVELDLKTVEVDSRNTRYRWPVRWVVEKVSSAFSADGSSKGRVLWLTDANGHSASVDVAPSYGSGLDTVAEDLIVAIEQRRAAA